MSAQETTGKIVCLATILSVLGTVLWILATSTEWWEQSHYDLNRLHALHPATDNYTVKNYTEQGLYLVTKSGDKPNSTEYLYEEHSGIWHMCSYLTDGNRTFLLNDSGVTDDWHAMYPCFIYVKHYKIPKIYTNMSEQSKWLVRMQNSATSCVIVVFLLMLSSVVLAPFGVIKRVVAVCMVVAVMYGIGTVFAIFGICIIHAKIDFMNSESKYIIGSAPSPDAYQARIVRVGWSIYIAWVSTVLQFVCFLTWTWVTRTIRPEKSAYVN